MNWQDAITLPLDLAKLTNDQIKSFVKAWRNQRLLESDWTQLPDVALTSDEAQAWAQYRHELREMLKQNDDPKLIVFPEPPK